MENIMEFNPGFKLTDAATQNIDGLIELLRRLSAESSRLNTEKEAMYDILISETESWKKVAEAKKIWMLDNVVTPKDIIEFGELIASYEASVVRANAFRNFSSKQADTIALYLKSIIDRFKELGLINLSKYLQS